MSNYLWINLTYREDDDPPDKMKRKSWVIHGENSLDPVEASLMTERMVKELILDVLGEGYE